MRKPITPPAIPTEEEISSSVLSLIAHYRNPVRVYVPEGYQGRSIVQGIPVLPAPVKTPCIECSGNHTFTLGGKPV